MAVCLPCEHTVDEKSAPKWAYKDVTFFFCSDGCEVEVKEEPEKWLVGARALKAEGRTTGHNTSAHHHPPAAHDEHAGHDHAAPGHGH